MAVCVDCKKQLKLLVEPEEEDEDEVMVEASSANTDCWVDDDVQLQCGCHFHWQCLLDAYSMTDCPNCASSLITSTPSGEEQLLCNLKNEGGFQEGLDILPILTEESYLQAYPEERKCRAFLEFCGKGDVEAILEVLDENADDEEDGDSDQKMDVLRYQDQIESMGTGLHLAIRNERMEVIWLLLFLASSIDIRQFPPEVLQAVQNSGLHREEQGGKLDIRSLKDGQGKTPEQTAAEVGGQLIDLVQTGRLKPPEN